MRRDELKQPLYKRSLAQRLWQRRPSALVMAFAVMFASYAAGGAWLAQQKMPFAGEPVLTLKVPPVEIIKKPVIVADVTPAKSGDAIDSEDVETGSTDPVIITPETARQKITKLDSHVTIITNSRPVLTRAPIADLVEDGKDGPLPKIGSNGKKPSVAYAKPASMNDIGSDQPKIVIILGGMGLNEKLTRRAIGDLPADVTFAFAPYGNNLQAQVDKARDEGHEVLLQLPLEPIDFPQTNPGPKTLLADSDPATFQDNLYWLMSRFAGYAGVINYMGGKFLSSPAPVKSLLAELKRRGLIFMEDGSLQTSATDDAAGSMGIPVRHGTAVIDQNPDPIAIAAELDQLEKQAQSGEIVIATGSGLDTTIDAVRDWIAAARARGVIILPASAAFKGRMG